MSGLKPVPRIPKWPSTMNGRDVATSAAAATGPPIPSASPAPRTRPWRNSSEPKVAAVTAIDEITPSPGSRTVAQQIAERRARPTAGESHDHPVTPHRVERRLADSQRGDADDHDRWIGLDHRSASLDCGHGVCPTRPPSPPRQGPRRRALLRAPRRRRHGPRRRPLTSPLQPRVPTRLRRAAALLPADATPRARGRPAPHHRPLGRRHLLLDRAAERRLVHDELQAAPSARRRPPIARPSRPRLTWPGFRPASCGSTAAPRHRTFREDSAPASA